MTRRIAVLGCTGSVGRQTLEVIEAFPDRFEVVALVGGRDEATLRDQLTRHTPKLAGLAALVEHDELRAGAQVLLEAATHEDVDLVVNAVVGSRGLEATLAALSAGKIVALANKESLVAGGELVAKLLPDLFERTMRLRPIDSEHASLRQALGGIRDHDVARLIVTASGGPFRGRARAQLTDVTVAEALQHPTWQMGERITIDCATLVNKGLELIEARWLFDIGGERLDTVVHPQSLVHAIVELVDGSMLMQAAMPDMRLPIMSALFDDERPDVGIERLDLAAAGSLTFEPVDHDTFPAIRLARAALAAGGSAPAILNAADEEAVAAFLAGRIGFLAITEIIEATLERIPAEPIGTLRHLSEIEARAREAAQTLIDTR
jgi:1-deoxy-D-xylulose-5-phosphate reductoisomerase